MSRMVFGMDHFDMPARDIVAAAVEYAREEMATHFPAIVKHLCFAQSPASIRAILADPTIEKPLKDNVRHALKYFDNERISDNGRTSCLLVYPDPDSENMPANLPFIALINIEPDPFKQHSRYFSPAEKSLLIEFALWHEVGHFLQSATLSLREIASSAHWSIMSANPEEEGFCDLLASSVLLKNHGSDAVPFLEKMSDLRLKTSIRKDSDCVFGGGHFTTIAIDTLLKTYEKDAITFPPLSELPAAIKRYMQFNRLDTRAFNENYDRSLAVVQNYENYTSKEAGRLLLSISRTLGQTPEERADFSKRYDLQADNTLADATALDFMMVYGFDVSDQTLGTDKIRTFLRDKKSYTDGNMFTGLGAFLGKKTVALTNTFARECASNEAAYAHSLYESYRARQLFVSLRDHARMHGITPTQDAPVLRR